MSPVAAFPDPEAARNEAAAWIACAFRGLTADEQATLREWSRRPMNQRAMAEMSDIWRGLDTLSVLADLFPRDGTAVPVAPAPPAPLRRTAGALCAGIAAALLVIVAAALFSVGHWREEPPRVAAGAGQGRDYTSAVGEHRSIPLADGSVLALNSDTLIRVEYTPTQRSLTLLRGEAHFDVAHDTARPFVVRVNSRSVRAVGTAFNVRRRGPLAHEVLVTEGVITTPQGTRLQAGDLLTIAEDGTSAVRRLDATQIEKTGAWRRGVLILDGITLAEAMDEVSRYTTRRIVIDDPRLASLRLGGSFPTTDLRGILRSLRASFGIDAHTDESGTLHLRPAMENPDRARDRGGGDVPGI
jgi:transmembrane sensor